MLGSEQQTAKGNGNEQKPMSKENTIRRNQKGFTVIEAVLIIVVIAIVAGTGWYVWRSVKNVNETDKQALASSNSISFLSYTDTAKLFTLVYPSNWVITPDSQPGHEGDAPPIDWSRVSRGFKLVSENAPKGADGAMIEAGSANGAMNLISENKTDKFHTVQKLTINGHTAYFDRLVYTGPSAAEKYTDDTYTIFNGDKALTLSFRESYYHNSVTPLINWNDVKDLAAFKGVVYSVKFVNN
jgi:hypothetical protein